MKEREEGIHRNPSRGADIYKEQGHLRNAKGNSGFGWQSSNRKGQWGRVRSKGPGCQADVFDFIVLSGGFQAGLWQDLTCVLSGSLTNCEQCRGWGGGFQGMGYEGMIKVEQRKCIYNALFLK